MSDKDSIIPKTPQRKKDYIAPTMTEYVSKGEMEALVRDEVAAQIVSLKNDLAKELRDIFSEQELTMQKMITASVAGFVTETQVVQRINTEFNTRLGPFSQLLNKVYSQQEIILKTLDSRFDAVMAHVRNNENDIAENRKDVELNQQLATQAQHTGQRALDSTEHLRIDLLGRDIPGPNDPKPILTIISENLADVTKHITDEAEKSRVAFGKVAKDIELRLVEDMANMDSRVLKLENTILLAKRFGQALTSKKVLAIGGSLGSVAAVVLKFIEFWSTH